MIPFHLSESSNGHGLRLRVCLVCNRFIFRSSLVLLMNGVASYTLTVIEKLYSEEHLGVHSETLIARCCSNLCHCSQHSAAAEGDGGHHELYLMYLKAL